VVNKHVHTQACNFVAPRCDGLFSAHIG
jgi:hypothetical protein